MQQPNPIQFWSPDRWELRFVLDFLLPVSIEREKPNEREKREKAERYITAVCDIVNPTVEVSSKNSEIIYSAGEDDRNRRRIAQRYEACEPCVFASSPRNLLSLVHP